VNANLPTVIDVQTSLDDRFHETCIMEPMG
jgi:hypothetical protein